MSFLYKAVGELGFSDKESVWHEPKYQGYININFSSFHICMNLAFAAMPKANVKLQPCV